MLRLREAIDENTLTIIQKMFMQYLNSSTVLYEADGSIANSIFEGKYCSFLNEISCKNAGACYEQALCSGDWICHEECWRVSKESMIKKEPVERECSGGITIYAVPIFYKDQIIGCINAGVTNPPLIKDKLEAVASIYQTNANILIQNAYTFKRLANEELKIARMQIRMAALLISSLYEAKVKQLEAEEKNRKKNKLIFEKSIMVERQKRQLEVELENLKNLQRVSSELLSKDNFQALYERIIDSAMGIMCAEYASMQIFYNDKVRKLKLLAYRGFTPEAVKSWEWIDVEKACTSCSQAVRTHKRVIVSDVQQCNFMQGSEDLDVYIKSGIYAVQSTPLISRNGRVLGIISTHWSKCNTPTERQLSLLDVLARQASDLIERKISEDALSESEERYRTLFEHMNEGFFLAEIICDAIKIVDYRFLAINNAIYSIFNYDKKHIIGKTAGEVSIFPVEWIEIFGQVAISGKPAFFESFSIELNRHFLLKVFSPRRSQFACLIQDITEAKNQSQIIRQQKDQLQTIIENMSDGVFLMDKDYKFTLLNKGARDFFYKPEGIIFNGDSLKHTQYYDVNGKSLTVEDLPGTRSLKGEALKNLMLTTKRPDKTIHFNVNSSPLYDENGNVEFVVICVRDFTLQFEQEKLLKEKKEQLEIITENMNDALFVFDKDGNYILINKTGRKRVDGKLQKSGDSYNYVEYFDLEGNKVFFEDTPNYHILHGKAFEEKTMLMKTPNKEMYINVSGSPIFDDKGNLLYGVIISRDVTENIANEQMIKNQQELLLNIEKEKNQTLENAMRMKDEFLATITHEFKTPLTVINAALQAIESIYGNQISDNIKRHLQRIRTNSYRQLRLVNNLLDITRYNAGHVKISKKNLDIIFLSRAIVKSVDIYAKQKGLELLFTTDCDCLEIGIDEEKFERIMLNLLSNAIKFTPKGKAIHVSLLCNKKKITISVRDEGIGIPKGKLKVIFERFGQVDSSLSRQAEGTGIGLSLVKALVTVLEGTISVESDAGKGTNFIFTLPIKKMRSKNQEFNMSATPDSRIMRAAAIEFSDIYMD